jgi:hypothetical protein
LLLFSSKSFVFPSHIQKIKIKIYKTVILTVVVYGCETWSLTLREEHRLRVFENRVLRRIFGPKRDEEESGENFIMMNFTACILHRILLGSLNQGGRGGLDMWHAWGRGEVFTGFLVGRPEGKRPLGRLRRSGRITLRWTLGR